MSFLFIRFFSCGSDVFLIFIFLFFFPQFILLCELLEEVLPQVGQLVDLRLVRVSILFLLEEPLEKLEILLLLLQSLLHSF